MTAVVAAIRGEEAVVVVDRSWIHADLRTGDGVPLRATDRPKLLAVSETVAVAVVGYAAFPDAETDRNLLDELHRHTAGLDGLQAVESATDLLRSVAAAVQRHAGNAAFPLPTAGELSVLTAVVISGDSSGVAPVTLISVPTSGATMVFPLRHSSSLAPPSVADALDQVARRAEQAATSAAAEGVLLAGLRSAAVREPVMLSADADSVITSDGRLTVAARPAPPSRSAFADGAHGPR